MSTDSLGHIPSGEVCYCIPYLCHIFKALGFYTKDLEGWGEGEIVA